MIADPEPPGAAANGRAIEALENGEVLYLPHDAFAMTNREHGFLEPGIVKQPRVIRPSPDHLSSGLATPAEDEAQGVARDDLQAMMTRFSGWAKDLVLDLLPDYVSGLTPGPATFRPCPRSGPQRLHVDSFFLFPTEGRRVLRVLTNIDPEGRPRVWQFGDEPFEHFASRLLPRVRATAGQRLAAGEARHHQGPPHAL